MNNLQTLTCPSCGARMNVAEDRPLTRCEYCGNEHLIRELADSSPRSQQPIRPKVAVPQSIQIEKDGKSAVIYQRWFSFKYVPMAFFCIAWDSFLCFWYSMAFSDASMPWIFFVFPIAHLAIGIGLTYSTIAGFLNRTVLEVTREELAVWFEPLPWIGERTIKVADLKQLYTTEKHTRTKRGYHTTYQLHAVKKDDHQVQLLSNLESPDIAVFFEQQLESWLNIEDQPVYGEVNR